jgi:pimeloyl-ACP methyl ester carboxylesterase
MTPLASNQTRIAYTDTGVGEPVLLIHCSTATGSEWRSLYKALGNDFHAIAPDQWGCGQSEPWSGQGTFDLGMEAAPIIEILQSLADPVHLVGHSYGGAVALRVARACPHMVRSLTLIEPSSFHLLRRGNSRDRVLFQEIAGVAETVRNAVACGDYWGGMAHFIDYWNGAGAWDAMPHDVHMTMSQRLGKVVLDFRALFEEPDGLSDYAALTMPTLILCGDCSPGPSRRIVDILAATMPQARVQHIAGAGHMSPLTHPDAVNAAIRGHLDRTSRERQPQARAA